MEDRKLTREEIALSILNGIVGSFVVDGHLGAISIPAGGGQVCADYREKACDLAFQMADLFIQKRDKKG